MWLGLGHPSGKKALCLGISFQKQVANPDTEFHETQLNLREKIISEYQNKSFRKYREHIYIYLYHLCLFIDRRDKFNPQKFQFSLLLAFVHFYLKQIFINK